LYGNSGAAVAAKLRLLSQAADATTRTFEARYVLDGALANAPLGSTITLNIAEDRSATQLLQVPIAALYDPGNGTGVWVIAGEPAKVSWRPVQVIGISDDTARVAGKLKAGEHVAALGAHLLRDGQEVRLAQAAVTPVAVSQP
jgi:multidrug efflux pump subunit AcrA (membrane-fusion protein)